jgi:hypothetical protein
VLHDTLEDTALTELDLAEAGVSKEILRRGQRAQAKKKPVEERYYEEFIPRVAKNRSRRRSSSRISQTISTRVARFRRSTQGEVRESESNPREKLIHLLRPCGSIQGGLKREPAAVAQGRRSSPSSEPRTRDAGEGAAERGRVAPRVTDRAPANCADCAARTGQDLHASVLREAGRGLARSDGLQLPSQGRA